jgi:hypothetical protein
MQAVTKNELHAGLAVIQAIGSAYRKDKRARRQASTVQLFEDDRRATARKSLPALMADAILTGDLGDSVYGSTEAGDPEAFYTDPTRQG